MLGAEQDGPTEEIGCMKPCCRLDLFLPLPWDRSLDLCPSASQLVQDMFSHPAGQVAGRCEPTQWPSEQDQLALEG